MLIEFRVENHRSIRDEQALTMEASLQGAEPDPRPRTVPGHGTPLLCATAIYGANASGKSNVLAALEFMREAVRNSHRRWEPSEGVPRDPFAWGSARSKPSAYITMLLLDGIKYEYGFELSDSEVLEEWLYVWPRGKKQVWFEREKSKIDFGDHLKGENKTIGGLTRRNSLFLSTAVQNDHQQLKSLYEWFSRRLRVNLRLFLPGFPGWITSMRPVLRDVYQSTVFRQLLTNADIGINDMRIEEEVEPTDSLAQPSKNRSKPLVIELRHGKSQKSWLPLERESKGTQMLFQIAPNIIQVLTTGGIVLVDELEASLHPRLAFAIIRQFNDPQLNPKNAQLIFTTHDTNFLGNALGEPLLRRDQIWFTEKDSKGATTLYPLTDYKPRKAENLERGYLQGRYGAIPFLGKLRFSGGDSA